MKKNIIFGLLCTVLTVTFPASLYAEGIQIDSSITEQTTQSSVDSNMMTSSDQTVPSDVLEPAINSSSKESEQDPLTPKKLNTWKDNGFTYTKIFQGGTLKPEDFVASIQDVHKIYVKEIRFADNQVANTSKPGIYHVTLTIISDDGTLYEADTPYLVQNKTPSINIYDINYNNKKNSISFTVSDNNAIVYMTPDSELVTYECKPDSNGHYEATLRKDKKPATISFIAMDLKGNYSKESIYLVETDNSDKTIPLSNISYQFDTHTLIGTTTPNATIAFYIDNETGSDKTITSDSNGDFSYTFEKTPTLITINISHNGKTQTYTFSPHKLDNADLNQIKKDAKSLPHTGESRNKWGFIVIGLALIVIVLFSILKRSSRVKKQN